MLIWFIMWGDVLIYLLYFVNMLVGLQYCDLGEVIVEDDEGGYF